MACVVRGGWLVVAAVWLVAGFAHATPIADARASALAAGEDHDDVGSNSGDADPAALFKKAFQDVFKPKFLEELNAQKRTGSDGEPLNFVDAEVLGFPPSPIPTDGDITKDMLSQMGGIELVDGEPVKFAATNAQFTPVLVSPFWFENDSSQTQQHEVDYTKQFTSSEEFSVSVGVSETIATTLTVGIPFFATASVTTSVTTTTKTGDTASDSKTVTYTVSESIAVPPHKIVNATCFIAVGKVDTTWSGSLFASDDTPVGWVYYDDRERTKDSGNFWIERADQSYAGLKRWRKLIYFAFRFEVPISGKYKAEAAASAARADIELHECPYSDSRKRCP